MRIKDDSVNKIERKIDKVDFRLVNKIDEKIEVQVIINGSYNTPIRINLPYLDRNPIKIISWLETIVSQQDNTPIELLIGRFQYGERNKVFTYCSIPNDTDAESQKASHPEMRIGRFTIYEKWCDKLVCDVLCYTDNFVRNFYNRMKRDIEEYNNISSEIIKSYFLNKPPLRVDYNGYFVILKISENDFRYNGTFYDNENPEEEIEGWGVYADDAEEAQPIIKSCINSIISHKNYKIRNHQWIESDVDRESVGCVFDIMPEHFRQRISSGDFDKRLINSVPGGDYEVPLYYVTKAWDVLLNGELGHLAFMIGPEEDYYDDDDEDGPDEFITDETKRTRMEACRDNDEMKSIWKEMLGIDIDKFDIDFSQFNKNMPPNVSEEVFETYFFDSVDGIFEWILGGVNYPNGQCTFDSVSALMEFTALVVNERKEGLI